MVNYGYDCFVRQNNGQCMTAQFSHIDLQILNYFHFHYQCFLLKSMIINSAKQNLPRIIDRKKILNELLKGADAEDWKGVHA